MDNQPKTEIHMSVQESIQLIRYPDLLSLGTTTCDNKLIYRIKQWYSESKKKYKVPDEVLNVALIIGMKYKKGVVPNNAYLNKILATMVNHSATNLVDAIIHLKGRFEYQSNEIANNKTIKKHYQNKAVASKENIDLKVTQLASKTV